jgi:hypothetical protein
MQVRDCSKDMLVMVDLRRNCNTMLGSLDCWKETTDGFSYGLATSMVDFCQVILKIRDFSNDKVRLILINFF